MAFWLGVFVFFDASHGLVIGSLCLLWRLTWSCGLGVFVFFDASLGLVIGRLCLLWRLTWSCDWASLFSLMPHMVLWLGVFVFFDASHGLVIGRLCFLWCLTWSCDWVSFFLSFFYYFSVLSLLSRNRWSSFYFMDIGLQTMEFNSMKSSLGIVRCNNSTSSVTCSF